LRFVSRSQIAWAVVVLGSLLHLQLAWKAFSTGYWDASGRGVAGRLDSVVAWSPLPRLGTLAVVIAPLVVLAACIVAAVRSGRAAGGSVRADA
jgi:hypothetical protein